MSYSSIHQPWEMAFNWICRMGIFKARSNDSSIADINSIQMFSANLLNGVVLCQILKHLNPRLNIDFVKTATYKERVSCVRNITTFLEVCCKSFDFSDSELFTVNDLYNLDNFEKVLKALAKLSNHSFSLMKGYVPFTIEPSSNKSGGHDRSVYNNLQKQTSSLPVPDNQIYDIIAVDDSNACEDSIYESILTYCKDIYSTEKINFTPTNEYEYAIQELVQTEGAYLESLNLLVDIRRICVQSNLAFFNEGVAEILFNNVSELQKLHTRVLKAMQDGCGNRPPTIAEAVLSNQCNFILYSTYVSGLDDAREALIELTKNAATKQYIDQILRDKQCREDIKSYIIVPFQRVLRYSLLFERLVKTNKDDEREKEKLNQVVSFFKDLSNHINTVKRDMEEEINILALQDTFVPSKYNLIVPDLLKLGHLLYDGEASLCYNQDFKKTKKVYLLLFDTRLLVCKRKNDNFELMHMLNLLSYTVSTIASTLKKDRSTYGWELVPSGSLINNARPSTATASYQYNISTITSNAHQSTNIASNTTSSSSVAALAAAAVANSTYANVNSSSCMNSTLNSSPPIGTSQTTSLSRANIVNSNSVSRSMQTDLGNMKMTFQVKSKEINEKWIQAIMTIVKRLLIASTIKQHNMELSNLPPGVTCHVCSNFLYGKMSQGYICLNCHIISHEKCLGGMEPCLKTALKKSNTGTEYQRKTFSPSYKTYKSQDCSSTSVYGLRSNASFARPNKNSGNYRAPHPLPGNTLEEVSPKQVPQRSPTVSVTSRNAFMLKTPRPLTTRTQESSTTMSNNNDGLFTSSSSMSNKMLKPYSYKKKWFMDNIDRKTAEEMLQNRANGSYLTRATTKQSDNSPYVLSFMFQGQVRHVKILYDDKYFLEPTVKFNRLDQLISYYSYNSLAECISKYDINLTEPVMGPLFQVELNNGVHIENFDEGKARVVEGRVYDVLNSDSANDKYLMKDTTDGRVFVFPKKFLRKLI